MSTTSMQLRSIIQASLSSMTQEQLDRLAVGVYLDIREELARDIAA